MFFFTFQSGQKEGNPLPKAYGGEVGAYSEPWGVRALKINEYWSRGPKTAIIFMPLPFLHILKEIETISPKKTCKKGRGYKR